MDTTPTSQSVPRAGAPGSRPGDPPGRIPAVITRRAFIARAAALGISVSAGGLLLAGCRQASPPIPSPTRPENPSPSLNGSAPVVNPRPALATYGPLLEATELVAASALPPSTSKLLTEIAGEAAIPLGTVVTSGARQARLSLSIDDPALADQAYALEVADDDDGPTVTIRAAGEPGAFYGLLTLAQLAMVDGPALQIRTAAIEDAPGFLRRGAILDPAPLTGVSTPASREELLERVRIGVRHKLNLVDLPSRVPWPDLVRYCDDHHVELMVAWGYGDALTTAPRRELKDQLVALLDAGARSIALNWDDISTSDPEDLAGRHAEVFLDLYTFLRNLDSEVRLSTVLPPYGGVPGQTLVFSSPGEGERYLAAMKTALPDDVRVFWTGDGGVFSPTVTTAGAAAYRDAIGHELGLWDNDTIGFSRDRTPCSGRAADLTTVLSAYMGNLAGEANWQGTNGEFALLTSLFYTWNPASYDPATAASEAERILVG